MNPARSHAREPELEPALVAEVAPARPERDPAELSAGGTRTDGRGLAPLWRYVVWALALAVVLGAWVAVRVQVRQLRMDIANLEDIRDRELEDRDQLLLEHSARQRVLALEAAASEAPLVTVPRRAAEPEGGAR